MERKKNKDAWLLTYSDMVTLLLVFFIIFINIVKPEFVRLKIILSSFTGNIGILDGGKAIEDSDSDFITLGNSIQGLPSQEVSKQKLNKADDRSLFLLKDLQDSPKVRVIENREGVIISLFTDIFFEPGTDRVNYDAVRDVLENIRQLIAYPDFQGEILINGHSDNVPPIGDGFRDNWELSMSRALQIFNALRQIPFAYPLNTERISVHAYGENRPLESNDTPEGRSYNRRVEIVLKR